MDVCIVSTHYTTLVHFAANMQMDISPFTVSKEQFIPVVLLHPDGHVAVNRVKVGHLRVKGGLGQYTVACTPSDSLTIII